MSSKVKSKKEMIRHKEEGNAISRYCSSFFHAVDGIVYAIEKEHNFIIMMIASLLVFLFAILFSVSFTELMILIILVALVMACEMVNTAIEAIVDLVTLEQHPLAGLAKDAAASASLILSIASFICGMIIFIPKILALF